MHTVNLIAPKAQDKPAQKQDIDGLEFPLERLPDAARDLAAEIARTRLLPPDLPGSLALVTASAALGKGLELDIPPHLTRGNIFLLATARSGTGKSDCFRDVTAPLFLAEEQANEAHEATRHRKAAEAKLLEGELAKIKGHSEGNIEKLAELTTKHEAALKALQPIRYTIEDATEPAMKQAFAANREQLALMSAEGGQVIANLLGRYGDAKGQTSDTVALKAFSGDADSQLRQGTGETRLKSPCLSIALIVTPDKAREMFTNPRFVDGGLMPRFLVATSNARPKRDDGTQRRPDGAILGRWEKTIIELVETYHRAQAPAVIQCEPEALEVFREYWNAEFVDCFDEIEGDAGFYARHVEQAKRLSVVLHALKHGSRACHKQLEAATAKDALAFVEWFVGNQEAAIANARLDQSQSLIERIAEAMHLHGQDTEQGRAVSLRTLKRTYSITRAELEQLAVAEPESYKQGELRPKTGRPSPAFIQLKA